MHYRVLVVKEPGNDKSINEIMAPFDENLKVEPYISISYDETVSAGREYVFEGKSERKYIDALDWGDKDFHDIYCREIFKNCNLDENGNVLSTYNPNSKYDYFTICDDDDDMCSLRIKPELQEEYNKSSASIVKKGDVDWDFMNSLSQDVLEKDIKFWKYCMEDAEIPPEDLKTYNIRKIEYYKEYFKNLFKDMDEYLRYQQAFRTYSIVTNDGKWHAPGNMGWFSSSESKEEDKRWALEYYDIFIKNLPDDAILIVLDCHI